MRHPYLFISQQFEIEKERAKFHEIDHALRWYDTLKVETKK